MWAYRPIYLSKYCPQTQQIMKDLKWESLKIFTQSQETHNLASSPEHVSSQTPEILQAPTHMGLIGQLISWRFFLLQDLGHCTVNGTSCTEAETFVTNN